MIPILIVHATLAAASAPGIPLEPPPAALLALPAASVPAAGPSLALPAAAPQATARPHLSAFDYDYIEVLLSVGDFRGVLVEGSHELQDRWLVVAKAGALTRSRADLTTVSAGVGYVLPLQERVDLVATGELELGRHEVDLPMGGSDRDTELGVRLRGGARFQLNREVELFGGVGIRTIFDNDLRLDGGALYALTDRVSLLGRLEIDDDTQVSVGARFGF